ncbi:astrotactin-2 isoform X1 [Sigmodon hispidus]
MLLLIFYNPLETTELGSKKELKSMPFITYLSGLLTAQMLSDDQLISGVEIRCEEKGRCPSTCHLCRRPGKEQLSPTPVLLEINHVVPLYTLIQDNGTKEAFKNALMSSYWCSGKGDVIDDWCRCDLSAFDASGLPNCSPLPQPVLRLSPTVEPSSTVVSLEWIDVQPAIGTKVSDYILQHKKVDEYTDTDLYTGEFLSFADDLLSGLGTSCVAAGRSHGEVPEVSIYSVIFKCLEPDGLYKFTLYAVDTRGRHSELSTVTLRTACPLVDDNKAEEIADKIYNLYNGYTSGKEQQTAYNTLMEVSASMLYRVQHHYNSHYEKFGDFVWRSEDELGPRKAHLILRRLERVSSHCSSLLRSAYIQSRVDTIPYLFCRSEEVRPAGMVWYSILKDTKITCEEKMVSMARNTYGETKGRKYQGADIALREALMDPQYNSDMMETAKRWNFHTGRRTQECYSSLCNLGIGRVPWWEMGCEQQGKQRLKWCHAKLPDICSLQMGKKSQDESAQPDTSTPGKSSFLILISRLG